MRSGIKNVCFFYMKKRLLTPAINPAIKTTNTRLFFMLITSSIYYHILDTIFLPNFLFSFFGLNGKKKEFRPILKNEYILMGILDKLFDKHKITNTLSRDLTKPIKQFGAKTSFNREYYRPNFNFGGGV